MKKERLLKQSAALLLVLSITLCICINFTVLNESAADAIWVEETATNLLDIDLDGYYEIYNATDLLAFSYLTRNHKQPALNVELAADIYFNEPLGFDRDTGLVAVYPRSYTPGQAPAFYVGCGIAGDTSGSDVTFDQTPAEEGYSYLPAQGGGYTKGEAYTLTKWLPIAYNTIGGYIGNFDGKGYKIHGLYMKNTSGLTFGLFDYVASGIIENVQVVDTVFLSSYGGGIVGRTNGNSLIRNCVFEGTLRVGAVGGGIVGSANGVIEHCINKGSVIGYVEKNHSQIGGIAGRLSGSVRYCGNEGTVSAYMAVGGIVGWAHGRVIGCYNTGSVSGNARVGGIIGENTGTHAVGCYSIGSVTGTSQVGGIVGTSQNAPSKHCYYLTGTASGGVDGADIAQRAEARDAAAFARGEVAYLLQQGLSEVGSTVCWGQALTGEEKASYPVPGGPRVYYGYVCEVLQYTNNEKAGENGPTHTYNNATCESAAVCTACGKTITPAFGHKSDDTCDTECNACGAVREPQHHSENADGKCDVCGERYTLSAALITLIALGGAVTLGGGGFCLYRILKKKN
ncbi:MAG: hypothetical protein IJW22_07660 [Clostridia bacterium]|nr:hypothetical protein [Clostridia bacterium]